MPPAGERVAVLALPPVPAGVGFTVQGVVLLGGALELSMPVILTLER